jgi:molybdopterin molybdotransferase
MLTLDEALARLLSATRPLAETESVSTFDALGRVLAEDVRSALDVPPADNTSMDGYALSCADVRAAGTLLPVSQRIPAGVVGRALEPGTAARIFTGAQVPAGADAVVMQEQCEAIGDGVRVNIVPTPGQWIRRRGEDVRQESVVLRAGTRLSPQSLGLAASVGAARLRVARRPRVALFSTGDELVMPGQPLKPGAIYNSNRFTLRGLIQALGCECADLGIVPDRLDATRAALREAAQDNDLIVTSGGVSVGEEDHLRPAVQAEGRLDLWQIAIKPGKPLAFGTRGDTLVFGLPGNPVSALVGAELFVKPALRALQGIADPLPRLEPGRLGGELRRNAERDEFVRARTRTDGDVIVLEPLRGQESHMIARAGAADALVHVPRGNGELTAGSGAFWLRLNAP